MVHDDQLMNVFLGMEDAGVDVKDPKLPIKERTQQSHEDYGLDGDAKQLRQFHCLPAALGAREREQVLAGSGSRSRSQRRSGHQKSNRARGTQCKLEEVLASLVATKLQRESLEAMLRRLGGTRTERQPTQGGLEAL